MRFSSGPAELLLEDEPRHNLALGIASFTRDHPDLYAELRGWVVREDGDVVGAALRTPPYNLVLARPRTDRAVGALADAITDELPGVVGAVPEVDAFAAAWAARRGVTPATRFDQRIYAMDELTRLAAWTAPCVSRTPETGRSHSTG